ncbi:MAG TPA: ABC transporter substrate-binding protein [Acidimicrobiales bacterium]|nr:ABC transporter substrate-binding protein [Acidimicrobiales bacterium]
MNARRLAAIAAGTALLASACGSSGGSSSNAAGGGGASAPGVTATSITIGSHQPLTGPAAPGYSEIAPATAALFAYVNAKGGVDGRKITYNYQDDAYNPSQTSTVVRKLVEQDGVFAILNGLGTPTHQQVQPFLNSNKVPDLFVASGCVCWNQPKQYPWTTGYQTNYAIEGRILGQYIAQNMAGQKVGYLLQNDDVGQGGKQGLDTELKPADVVSQQSYDVSALTSGLGTQMSKLQQAGAQVVVGFAIPAAFALAELAAAQIGYHPQFVVSSIAADPYTMGGLLQSFSKGAAGASLLNGVITASYLPSFTDTSNPWTTLFKKIHDQYDAKNPFDANTIFGMSVGYNFVQLLQKAGKNLTRQSLLDAVNSADLQGPGLLPLTFSPTDHRGYEGEQMAKIQDGNLTAFGPVYKATETGPITTYTGPQATPPANF